jgi:hypothetical protein
MDVQCYVSDEYEAQKNSSLSSSSSTAESKTYVFTDADVHQGQHVECVETGFGVSCFITDDEPSTTAQTQAPEQQQQQQQQPMTAAAAASGEGGLLQQLLGVALLISPFFFWGTSMVAMKVRQQKSTAASVTPAFCIVDAAFASRNFQCISCGDCYALLDAVDLSWMHQLQGACTAGSTVFAYCEVVVYRFLQGLSRHCWYTAPTAQACIGAGALPHVLNHYRIRPRIPS